VSGDLFRQRFAGLGDNPRRVLSGAEYWFYFPDLVERRKAVGLSSYRYGLDTLTAEEWAACFDPQCGGLDECPREFDRSLLL